MKKRCIQKKMLNGLGGFDDADRGLSAELRYNMTISEEDNTYGLEIEKTVISESGESDCEFAMFHAIAKDEQSAAALIERMSNNCVLPVELRYILEDMNLI